MQYMDVGGSSNILLFLSTQPGLSKKMPPAENGLGQSMSSVEAFLEPSSDLHRE